MAGPLEPVGGRAAPNSAEAPRAAANVPRAPQGEAGSPDALAAVSALAAATTESGGLPDDPPGLAEELMAFVTPRLRHPDALAPSRILPLLRLAVLDMPPPAPGSEDEVSRLALAALQEELAQHRELAERRGTLIDGTP